MTEYQFAEAMKLHAKVAKLTACIDDIRSAASVTLTADGHHDVTECSLRIADVLESRLCVLKRRLKELLE